MRAALPAIRPFERLGESVRVGFKLFAGRTDETVGERGWEPSLSGDIASLSLEQLLAGHLQLALGIAP